MNMFASSHRNQPWVWQVTGLCFVLGLLLAGSLQTVRNISRSGIGTSRIGVPQTGVPVRTETVQKLEKEIKDLREHNTELENALGTGKGQLKTLNDELQKVKILAGLTEVKGPGISLLLADSKKRPPAMRSFEVTIGIVHDVDLQRVVYELLASGAEAIAVNNQRVVARSAIRCVGPTIQVNGVPLAPPYTIHAIGDPGALYGGMNLPFGVLDEMRRYDPAMVKLEKKELLVLPAFGGSTETKFAQVTTDLGSAAGEAQRR